LRVCAQPDQWHNSDPFLILKSTMYGINYEDVLAKLLTLNNIPPLHFQRTVFEFVFIFYANMVQRFVVF